MNASIKASLGEAADLTFVSLLTPSGRGAIATVLVQGVQALGVVQQLFQPAGTRPLGERTLGEIAFGRWAVGGEELVVACRTNSCVEVHCHGGRAAATAIVSSLIAVGCREVPWSAALTENAQPTIAVEARLALAEARTERVAAILLDQFRGALSQAFAEVEQLIAARDFLAAEKRLDELNNHLPVGQHLTTPWRIVLAGRPNVGKSSLINALLGYQRAIVFDQPGTTRDVVTATSAIDGWPVEFADTAGIHESNNALEVAGIHLAEQRVVAADLVLLVRDATQPWSDDDDELFDKSKAAIIVNNKCDLGSFESPHNNRQQTQTFVSALHGSGMDRLLTLISQRLVPKPPPPGTAVPFTARHREWLQAATDRTQRARRLPAT